MEVVIAKLVQLQRREDLVRTAKLHQQVTQSGVFAKQSLSIPYVFHPYGYVHNMGRQTKCVRSKVGKGLTCALSSEDRGIII